MQFLRFTITDSDGNILQINEAYTTEKLEDIQKRIPAGKQLVEYGPEVTMRHKYNAVKKEFELPEE